MAPAPRCTAPPHRTSRATPASTTTTARSSLRPRSPHRSSALSCGTAAKPGSVTQPESPFVRLEPVGAVERGVHVKRERGPSEVHLGSGDLGLDLDPDLRIIGELEHKLARAHRLAG